MLRQRRCHWQNLSWSWVWCWKSVIKDSASWPLPSLGWDLLLTQELLFCFKASPGCFWKALILSSQTAPANTQSGDYRSWYFFFSSLFPARFYQQHTYCVPNSYAPSSSSCSWVPLFLSLPHIWLMSPTETPLLTFMWNSVRHQLVICRWAHVLLSSPNQHFLHMRPVSQTFIWLWLLRIIKDWERQDGLANSAALESELSPSC